MGDLDEPTVRLLKVVGGISGEVSLSAHGYGQRALESALRLAGCMAHTVSGSGYSLCSFGRLTLEDRVTV